jgi:cell division transport system permease protein
MQQMEQSVGISVFFEPGISAERKDQIGEEIKKKEDIATMRYVSAEEAWESYKKDVFQGNEELLEGFEGNNPLKESDSYEITLKEVKSYKQVVSHLETIDGVRKVRYSEGAAEGMTKINTMGTYLAGGIILILMAVSIFLVSNTVSIGVAVREEEISIMKLIGAANGFIKAPFRAEGMIIGIFGALIPTAIIFAGYEGIINWMNDKFHVVTVFMKFVPIQQIMLYLLPLSLIVGIVIGLLGSSITIRKYLKV